MGYFLGSAEFVLCFWRCRKPCGRQCHRQIGDRGAMWHGTLGERPVLGNWAGLARALLRAFRVAPALASRGDGHHLAVICSSCTRTRRTDFRTSTVPGSLVRHCSSKANRPSYSQEPHLTLSVGRTGALVFGICNIRALRFRHRGLYGHSCGRPPATASLDARAS